MNNWLIFIKRINFIFLCFLAALQATPNFAETNIYAYTQAGMLSPQVKNALFRVYVPNGDSDTVSVIDPIAYKVIQTFVSGKNPQHVVPSYDLQTLWVLNDKNNSMTPIDAQTGQPGKNIDVDDPYNLYYTPDGKFAIVVSEARKQLHLLDPKTMKVVSSIPIQCLGANHMDFLLNGHEAIVTCEFSGQVAKIDFAKQQVVGYLSLRATPTKINSSKKMTVSEFNIKPDGQVATPPNTVATDPPENKESMPQDIRSSADGKIFFVADMMQDGLVLIDPISLKKIGFIPAGIGTHGIYPSRDGKLFYVSNRGCHHIRCGPHGPGNISVVDPVQKKVVATWPIPQGGSPDMGNITADGKELWLSGRYDSEVYVFDTVTGNLTHRIPVGKGPHGLAVWPQPGRYSLGHTGNMR